eukprot:3777701-Rhodomonas_salina.1
MKYLPSRGSLDFRSSTPLLPVWTMLGLQLMKPTLHGTSFPHPSARDSRSCDRGADQGTLSSSIADELNRHTLEAPSRARTGPLSASPHTRKDRSSVGFAEFRVSESARQHLL